MALKTNAEMLEIWQAAAIAVANGQAYTSNGLSVTKANAREIREWIEFYEKKVNDASRGSNPQILPTFNHSGGQG